MACVLTGEAAPFELGCSTMFDVGASVSGSFFATAPAIGRTSAYDGSSYVDNWATDVGGLGGILQKEGAIDDKHYIYSSARAVKSSATLWICLFRWPRGMFAPLAPTYNPSPSMARFALVGCIQPEATTEVARAAGTACSGTGQTSSHGMFAERGLRIFDATRRKVMQEEGNIPFSWCSFAQNREAFRIVARWCSFMKSV